MKSSIEEISPVKKKLVVEIEADEVERKIEKAYRDFGKQIRLPGFRPGKIPRNVIEGRFAKEVLSDVTRELISDTLPKALDENDTIPLNMPTLENEQVKKGESFTYTAVMEVRPVFELNNYKGLDVEKEILSVNPEEVDKQIEDIRRASGLLRSVEEDRGVREGDHAQISFKGMEDGEPVAGLEAEDHTVKVGAGEFHPEFEKGIIGLRKGETKSVHVEFEESFNDKNVAGKGIDFQVELKEIKTLELPALDDEFAKALDDKLTSLEDLKEEIRKELTRREEGRIDRELKTRLVEKVCETVDFELPESLIDMELNNAIQNIVQNMYRSGGVPDMAGFDDDKLRKELLPGAESRIKRMLVLAEIAKQNDLTITEEDILNGMNELASGAGQDPAVVRRFYEDQNLMDSFRERLLEQKTLNFLVDCSNIIEIDAEKKSKTES